MRKSIKAVLLSALVLPGTGHFSLKKPVLGSLLLGISLVCLYFIFSAILKISKDISAQIQSNELAFDAAQINEMVTEKLSGSGDQVINISALILIMCWIVGVVDSFRLGRLEEKK